MLIGWNITSIDIHENILSVWLLSIVENPGNFHPGRGDSLPGECLENTQYLFLENSVAVLGTFMYIEVPFDVPLVGKIRIYQCKLCAAENVREFYSPILATMTEIRALRLYPRYKRRNALLKMPAQKYISVFCKRLLFIGQGDIFNYSLHKFDIYRRRRSLLTPGFESSVHCCSLAAALFRIVVFVLISSSRWRPSI